MWDILFILMVKKIVFYLVPTSILHSNIKSIIGTGTYINLEKLVDEIKYLNLMGISCDNLYISDKAHVILAYHVIEDELQEKLRKSKIGSSHSGIGPCVSDKYLKRGIRIDDLYDDLFLSKLNDNLKVKNNTFKNYGYNYYYLSSFFISILNVIFLSI